MTYPQNAQRSSDPIKSIIDDYQKSTIPSGSGISLGEKKDGTAMNEPLKCENTRKPSMERPWMKYYPKDADTLEFPRCSLYAFLQKAVHSNPDGNAIYYENCKCKLDTKTVKISSS